MDSETNTETPSPKSLRKPRQRKRGILIATLVIVVSLAIVTLTTLAYRPQWRPLTGTHEPKDAALVMDCPENWIISEVPGLANNKSSTQMFSSFLTLKMRPLTGLPAWWQKYILRQENTASDNSMIMAYTTRDSSLMTFGTSLPQGDPTKPRTRAEAEKMLDAFEKAYTPFLRRGIPGNPPFTLRRVEHSLGPALEIDGDMTLSANRLPNGATFTGKLHAYMLYIAPLTAPPDNGMILMSCSMPSRQYAFLKPTLERMFRSMRLVRR